MSDYGLKLDSYLRTLEKTSTIGNDHLKFHEVRASFRARMVDWMCEVLNIAFKSQCTDQTFFVAVNILDRYIKALEDRNQVFKSSDLHSTGVTAMFIASKYEDVHPLLMKTVFNKIGHTKVPEQTIIDKE